MAAYCSTPIRASALFDRSQDAHVPFGTTSLLPTLISDDYDIIRQAIAAVREAIDSHVPGIIGIHIEGPFLNPERKGAHDESKFRSLDDEAFDILTSLGSDAVTLVTLAPERNDLERVRALVDAGNCRFRWAYGGHVRSMPAR